MKTLRPILEKTFKDKGGSPALAIPWETTGGDIVWACPLDHRYVLVTRKDNPASAKMILMASLKKATGQTACRGDFPAPPPKEDPALEIKIAFSEHPGVAHNGKPQLAWYRQSLEKLQGILLPAERKEEVAHALSLEQRLRQMAQFPTT